MSCARVGANRFREESAEHCRPQQRTAARVQDASWGAIHESSRASDLPRTKEATRACGPNPMPG
eukprot:1184409-Alexandrium_andersonii.AAC.1